MGSRGERAIQSCDRQSESAGKFEINGVVDAEGVFAGERHNHIAGWLAIDVDREPVEIGEEAGALSGVDPAASLTNNEDVPDLRPP